MNALGLRMLLIDDNEDHATILQYAIQQRHGVQLETINDGGAAIEVLIAGQGGKTDLPDLILLDLNMPRIDGRELLRQLKSNERTKYIPVIVLSSSERLEDIRYAYEMGACSYISKSTLLCNFSTTIPLFIDYWKEMALLPYRRNHHDD